MGYCAYAGKFRRVIGLLAVFVSAGRAEDAPKKVTVADAVKAIITRVQPEYPSVARQLKLAGSVELEALVGETGRVEKVSIVSGNPVLTKPAAEALKGWKFSPFIEDGKAVKVIAPVKISFSM